jgi:tRNA pseudouridine55 synthase
VEVYNIRLLDFSPPALSLEVDSGKGVYIRSLAHDLGEALGCGGYVTDLERLSCGGFRSEEAITLEQLEQANASSPTGWQQHLYPVDWTLQHLQSISVGPQAEKYLRNGQAISLGRPVVGAGYLEQFRAYSIDGCFLALVRFDRSVNAWQPMKVFQLDSPSPYAPVTNQ